MPARLYRWQRLCTGALIVTTLLFASLVQGDDKEIAEFKARLERIEQLNEKLTTQNGQLRQQFDQLLEQRQSGVSAASPNASQLNGKEQLEQAVDDYLKSLDEEKKRAEEQKKKDAETQGYEVGSDLVFKTFWRDGFNAETVNRDFRVHLGGRIHVDGGWFKPDQNLESLAGPAGWLDGVDLRRLRFRADGTMYEVIDWILETEFASGVAGTTNHPVPTDATSHSLICRWSVPSISGISRSPSVTTITAPLIITFCSWKGPTPTTLLVLVEISA